MTYQDGELTPRTTDEWLQLILEAGSDYWGTDIIERDETSIHQFYEPFAASLSELEVEMQEVLQALRLDTAEGGELDRIGNRYGVNRIQAKRAVGEVTFSRSTDASKDYLIQSGTVVQTEGQDEIQFATTEKATLASGTQSVTVPIEGIERGSRWNVAADVIIDTPLGIDGVESITNTAPTTGGRETELDEAYRLRITNSVGDTQSASGFQIYKQLTAKKYIQEIKYIDNSSDSNTANLGPHEAEVVVDAESGYTDNIAQIIYENIPIGIDLVSGNYGTATSGTATLPNGQTFTIPFSDPTKVDIYIDVTVDTTTDVGATKIKREIVEYIGGTKPNNELIFGEITIGDDVIYGDVDFAIRGINGVYDVASLEIGKSSSPTGTSTVAIGTTEQASVDAVNINVTEQ